MGIVLAENQRPREIGYSGFVHELCCRLQEFVSGKYAELRSRFGKSIFVPSRRCGPITW